MDLKDPKIESQEKWAECLRKIAEQQDMAAFKQFYEHFGPLIKSFAYKASSLQSSDTIAEELVQESMIKIWAKAPTFDAERASISTWVYTIARNTRIDLLRKYQRHTHKRVHFGGEDDSFDIEDIWIDDDQSGPFDQLAQQRQKSSISKHLDDLPMEQALIIRKIYVEGKSHSEVAGEMELALGTVKSRVRLGLKKLRVNLSRQVI